MGWLGALVLALTMGGLAAEPLPEKQDAKPAFEKAVFTNADSGASIALVSATECEIKDGAAEPVRHGEYTHQGDKLKIVLKSAEGADVLFYDVTDLGLVAAQTRQLFSNGTKADLLSPQDLRKIATETLEMLRILDAATDQWSIELGKMAGTPVALKDLAPYIKTGSRLHKACLLGRCVDLLGNPITVTAVDTPPRLSKESFDKLSKVAPEAFWEPYLAK